jgi:hypothetical protein
MAYLGGSLKAPQGPRRQYLLLDTKSTPVSGSQASVTGSGGRHINLALATPFGASKRRESIKPSALCSGPLDGWLESLEMMMTPLSTRRAPQSQMQIGSGRGDAADSGVMVSSSLPAPAPR